MHGHEDSVTDIKFVRRTHNFFSSSKDGTVRYWDGDRHEQILLLNGHCAEVNCLAVSRTGAFVLSGGMDRQVRVWERTKDIVFLEEERERELEKIFDQVNDRNEGGTASILDGKRGDDDDDDEDVAKDDEPQSEAAVRKSVLSVSAGDRIMEALERADNETKAITLFVRTHGSDKKRPPNLLMLGHSPSAYILWVLRTIKSADLEQSLIVLPLGHIERLLYYIIVLLKRGQGIELCSRVAIFLIKTHQNQVRAVKPSWKFISGAKDDCFTCQTTSKRYTGSSMVIKLYYTQISEHNGIQLVHYCQRNHLTKLTLTVYRSWRTAQWRHHFAS